MRKDERRGGEGRGESHEGRESKAVAGGDEMEKRGKGRRREKKAMRKEECSSRKEECSRRKEECSRRTEREGAEGKKRGKGRTGKVVDGDEER